jgi:hypothetical protein
MSKISLIYIVSFSVIILSCKKEQVIYNLIDSESFKDSLIKNSTDTLAQGNVEMILTTHLIRNFFPESPPDGRPLVSYIFLATSDSSKIPPNLKLNKQYVILDNQIWIASFSPLVSYYGYTPDYMLAGTSIDGPKWGPNISVTVVAEVSDSLSGKLHWIRAISQEIEISF